MAIPREPPQYGGLRRDYTPPPQITKAYLFGALHDATIRKTTYRLSQKSREYVELLAQGIRKLGGNAWVYKEGKQRHVYIVEFSKSFLKNVRVTSSQEKIEYIRGISIPMVELRKVIQFGITYIFVKRIVKIF